MVAPCRQVFNTNTVKTAVSYLRHKQQKKCALKSRIMRD